MSVRGLAVITFAGWMSGICRPPSTSQYKHYRQSKRRQHDKAHPAGQTSLRGLGAETCGAETFTPVPTGASAYHLQIKKQNLANILACGMTPRPSCCTWVSGVAHEQGKQKMSAFTHENLGW